MRIPKVPSPVDRVDAAAVEDVFGNTHHFQTCNTEFELHAVFPDENPKNALYDVVDAMAHVGLFDGFKRDLA